ncbi:MAG: hypothetical protein ACF8XB_09520 [Planctomycetota bacterium JB042]
MLTARALASILLVPLALSACDVEFRTQEVLLRHDPTTDTAELFLIHGDLVSDRPSRGADAVERLLAGEREFVVASWPLHFRVDAWEEDVRRVVADPDSAGTERRLATGALAVLERITLVESGLFLDAEGRPGGWQRFRLRDASAAVARLNEMISWAVLAAVAAGDLAPDDDLDARTISLWTGHAEAGRTWFALHGGRLVVDVPLSKRAAARALSELVAGLARERDDVFARLLSAILADVEALEIARERLHVELRPADESGTFSWSIENPEIVPSDALLTELRSRGVEIREDVTPETLRRKLRR